MSTAYRLHLLPGGEGADAAPLSFASKTQAGALREARRLWETRAPGAGSDGYRLVHEETGAVVYEYRRSG